LHFFLLSLGGEGFRGEYFSVFPSFHYVDHLTISSLWLGPQGKGKGAFPANHELPHQHTDTHFFIVVDMPKRQKKLN
jgi:hypothetical protein